MECSSIHVKPLILTALLDEKSQEFFNLKRKFFFPKNKNYINAHLTLFHQLPNNKLKNIREFLLSECSKIKVMHATVSSLMFLGFGTAYKIECDELIFIRKKLVNQWHEMLINQDLNHFVPHITIQNKVDPKQAKSTFLNIQEDFEPFDLDIIGLQLWYYEGGPWTHLENFTFML